MTPQQKDLLLWLLDFFDRDGYIVTMTCHGGQEGSTHLHAEVRGTSQFRMSMPFDNPHNTRFWWVSTAHIADVEALYERIKLMPS